jgi:Tfp pilus assembly protein PilV
MKIYSLLKKHLRKQGGYLTLEVILVFTVVLFSLLLLIYLGIALYQQVSLQSSVQLVASQGATMYASGSAEPATAARSLESYKDQNPYVNFLDASARAEAESNIRAAIATAANQHEVYKGSNNTTDAEIKRDFVAQKVIVRASRDYAMPVASVGEMFGLNSPLKVDVAAAAPVTNPVEVIRTADICVDLLLYFDGTKTVIEKLGYYRDKAIGFMNGLDISGD